MVRAELLYRVIKVFEERAEITEAAEEARDAADADEAAGVADGLHRVVGLAAEVLVEARASRVAGHHRLLRGPRRLAARAPAGVCHIHNDAEAVHLRDHGMAKVREAAVVRLARAIADSVPTVVGEVHHSHTQLLKDADEA